MSDDTAAINAAIQDGGRCGNGTCDSSTITPAIIYFPAGTYLVSTPIIAWYYSQLIGDPLNRPTIKGAPGFAGIGLIDSDPYLPGGANWVRSKSPRSYKLKRHPVNILFIVHQPKQFLQGHPQLCH